MGWSPLGAFSKKSQDDKYLYTNGESEKTVSSIRPLLPKESFSSSDNQPTDSLKNAASSSEETKVDNH